MWLSHQSDSALSTAARASSFISLLIFPFLPSSIGFMCIHWSQAHTAQQLERFVASKDAHSQIRLILTLACPIHGAWIGCSLNESHVSILNLSDEADARVRVRSSTRTALAYTTHWQSAFSISFPFFTIHWKLIHYLSLPLKTLIL